MKNRASTLLSTITMIGMVWGLAMMAQGQDFAPAQKTVDVSGAYYDWKLTHQPERPYLHRYDQTLVTKI